MAIEIVFPPEISQAEADKYVESERKLWDLAGKDISKIELSIDGDDVIITATEKSPIKRIRRITGYCVCVDNFNDAKKAELNDRVKHIK